MQAIADCTAKRYHADGMTYCLAEIIIIITIGLIADTSILLFG